MQSEPITVRLFWVFVSGIVGIPVGVISCWLYGCLRKRQKKKTGKYFTIDRTANEVSFEGYYRGPKKIEDFISEQTK